MKKTVLEWLSEGKLLEKKIEKKEANLIKNAYKITMVHNEDKNYNEEAIKAEYVSLNKLKDNLDLIKDSIMVYNATTKIKIGDKEMSLAYALNKYANRAKSDFDKKLVKVGNDRITDESKMRELSQREKADLDRQLNAKSNISEKDKALIEMTKGTYDVVVKDPLNVIELASKVADEMELFNMEVNNKINLSNATTYLDLNI